MLLPWLHRYFEQRASVQGMSPKVDATYLSAGFIMALALFATGSRAGLVIVIGAFAVWLGFAFAKKIQWWPLAAASLVSAGAYFLAGAALAEPSAALTSQAADIDRVLGADLELREAFVRLALANYADYPLTGIGIFVFPLLYRFQRPIIDQDSAGLYVHNDYLQLLTEGGPLLFCAMLAFVAGAVALFLRGLLARPGQAAFSRLGFVMGVGAALAHAMVKFVVYSPALGFALGITAARAFRGAAKPESADEVRDRPIRIAVASVLAFGWIAWLYLGLDTAIAGILQNQRYVPFAEQVRSDPERMFRFARTAQSLNGNRG